MNTSTDLLPLDTLLQMIAQNHLEQSELLTTVLISMNTLQTRKMVLQALYGNVISKLIGELENIANKSDNPYSKDLLILHDIAATLQCQTNAFNDTETQLLIVLQNNEQLQQSVHFWAKCAENRRKLLVQFEDNLDEIVNEIKAIKSIALDNLKSKLDDIDFNLTQEMLDKLEQKVNQFNPNYQVNDNLDF